MEAEMGKEEDVLGEIERELEEGKYMEVVDKYYKEKSEINGEKYARVMGEKWEQEEKIRRGMKVIGKKVGWEQVRDGVAKLLVESEERKEMPTMFYIEEKQKVFKWFEFGEQRIHQREILGDKEIPMFAGIGTVRNRIFIFGGKETDTRQITNKAYELVWNETSEENLKIVPINRMIKSRGRCAVASMDKKLGIFQEFIVLIGGSDEYSSLL